VAESEVVPPHVEQERTVSHPPRVVSRGAPLSPRERDVLDAMTRGAKNSEIAAGLFISEETVKSHVKRILRKLGASNRAQAVSCYLQRDP
jgi:DNA-binding NarL/FixJ family response regulator